MSNCWKSHVKAKIYYFQIKAHKYILMSRSVVFYTMFNGSLPENTNKPISIPDVEPDAFKLLCLYVLTFIILKNVVCFFTSLQTSFNDINPVCRCLAQEGY